MPIQHYLALLRLRTLPLAWAVIILGNALVWYDPNWQASVFGLSLLTTLLLQMVSNVANDYGDGLRGSDRFRAPNAPARLTHQLHDKKPVRRLLTALIALSIVSGLLLLHCADVTSGELFTFILLGALAVVAALTYTLGKRPYGYDGWGEASVLLFFGWLGVMGSAYLQTHEWHAAWLLPATGCGILCAAVLHINNMRDLAADKLAGKHTLALRLGFSGSLKMWWVMQVAAILCYSIYAFATRWYAFSWLLVMPFWWRYKRAMNAVTNSQEVGLQLKNAVMLVLIWQILLWLGVWLWG
ncbi:1,4-dihydroxy-2-naphthoate octaprenyltransferase [Neisseriaceae bacterium B1]